MLDIDPVFIDRDWGEGQAGELKPPPGPKESRILDPHGMAPQAENVERESKPGAESPGDDDLRW
jgi:hypothetical protein